MPDYKNLSVGKFLESGKHEIYTVPEGKEITLALLTFTNLGSEDIIISIFKDGIFDGTFLSKVGYGYNPTYQGLDGYTIAEGETISFSYDESFNVSYALVGVESDA